MLSALCGCASFAVKHAGVYQALQRGNPDLALQELESRGRSKRNQALYDLDKAMLLSMTGQYGAGNEVYELAKLEMQELSATSVTENLTAVMVNEGTRRYAGQPYEHILLYAYKALNYLALNDIDGARVEMLQADVKIREWASSNEFEGIEGSAFVRTLAGIVFEINKEWSEALIAYRKAYKVLIETEKPVPVFLQSNLLRLTEYQGLKDEHEKFEQEFTLTSWPDMQSLKKHAQVIFILHQGLVPIMRQNSVFHFSPALTYNVRISVPFYPYYHSPIQSMVLQIGNQQQHTELIEDVDQLARSNLNARMPGIMARTVARVAAKKIAARETGKEDGLAGLFVDIAGIATEVADTRSWTSLPANIQIARVIVPPGEHKIRLPGNRLINTPSVIKAAIKVEEGETIELQAGQIKVISIHSIVKQRTGGAYYE